MVDSLPETSATSCPNIPQFKYNLPLFKAVVRGDWETCKGFFHSDPSTLTAVISEKGETALFLTVWAGQTRLKFITELMHLMPAEALAIPDKDGYTALHCAAANGDTNIAQMLVRKNPDLTKIQNRKGNTPLARAIKYGHRELVWYLCWVTGDEYPSPYRGAAGATLLVDSINAELYDVALNLLRLYPEMATTRGHHRRLAICMLATKCWSLPSRNWTWFWPLSITSFPGLSNANDTKIMHKQYIELVKRICDEVLLLDDEAKKRELLNGVTLIASEHGNAEFIKLVIDADPRHLWDCNACQQSAFHIAVKHRQEMVFKYLTDMGEYTNACSTWRNINGEGIMHLAAEMGPPFKLSQITGPALQMQHELQWYKEVEKNVQSVYRTWNNPRQLFTVNHKTLVEKGEMWMKDMANPSMLAGTLVATVVFAAAFTVPGGNTNDKGTPIFINTRSYMIFAVSNALSFFSSLTSVLMFLSILTARYAEDDFLKSLPQKLIIGLVMLFFAIIFMTIGFSATYFIMLGRQLAWVAILLALLVCFPVAIFALLQLPLLVEMIYSTYRPALCS